MATYLVLFTWTEQGIKEIKDSPRRVDAARELARTFGVEFSAFYMTLGAYDTVARLEAPSDDAKPSISSLCVLVGRFGLTPPSPDTLTSGLLFDATTPCHPPLSGR